MPPKASNGVAKSPTQSSAPEPQNSMKSEPKSSSEASSRPLAPPPAPKPGQNGDYFSTNQARGSLSMEPNPFEQSFGGAPADTPGGTKLPSVAALTSPSSLLPGDGTTPFNWGGNSLRSGPLSPAMLSGPANDYFGDSHLRGGFPTPNESSMRTGMTPGGSGSMFPAQSPATQTLFAQLQSGSATPDTLNFHRTAVAAAAMKNSGSNMSNGSSMSNGNGMNGVQQAPTSVPQSGGPTSVPPSATVLDTGTAGNGSGAQKNEHKSYDQDSNAANSLFLLAQGRGSAQPQAQFVAPPPPTVVPVTLQQNPNPNQGSLAPAVSHPPIHQTPVPIPVVPGRPGQSMGMSANGSNGSNGSHGSNGSNGNNGMGYASGVKAETGDLGHGRRVSDANSVASQNSNGEKAARSTKGRGKRNSNDAGLTAGSRRKAEGGAKTGTAKKAKTTAAAASAKMDEEEMASDDDDDDDEDKSKMTEEEKRKNFLERNRVAALKCRQRKKQWLQNLQNKVDVFSSENETLMKQIQQLREEVVNLKTILMVHKDCPMPAETREAAEHQARLDALEHTKAAHPHAAPYMHHQSLDPNHRPFTNMAVPPGMQNQLTVGMHVNYVAQNSVADATTTVPASSMMHSGMGQSVIPPPNGMMPQGMVAGGMGPGGMGHAGMHDQRRFS